MFGVEGCGVCLVWKEVMCVFGVEGGGVCLVWRE